MPKRHYDNMSEHKRMRKKIRPRIKLAIAPPINSLADLVEIGKSITFYKGIDMVMLWRITPYLEELNNLIGMQSFKDSIFHQILYYMQGMHTRGNEEYLHTIMIGPPGTGKCLAKNTPVLMYNGTINMVQDIKQGDKLMGDNSTPRTVISTCQGRECMYRIEQLYGDNYVVNESHILSLKLSKSPRIRFIPKSRRYSVIWHDKQGERSKVFTYYGEEAQKKAKIDADQFLSTLPLKGTVIDISVKEYMSRSKSWKTAYKGYKVGVEYSDSEIDIDPYIIGYWLGDGTSEKPQITTVDEEIVKYFTKYFSQLHVTPNKTGITYDISSKINGGNTKDGRNRFVVALRKYNLLNNKHIPHEYLINSRQKRLELLAGLLDADGYLDRIGNVFDFVQKNKELSYQIQTLVRSLGLKTTIREVKKSCKYRGEIREGTYYRMCISGNIDIIPTKILRKQPQKRMSNKDPLVYNIKVVKLEEDDYYGFQLDGNHRFLLGDFTVTHNTTAAKILGKIYQSMGILAKDGPFKIAHRDDFIAGYLGQTALKTQKLLKSCIGGVLFIDEVYALAPRKNDKDSFADEALDILCSFMSEHKNDTCIIAAGYEDDIKNRLFAKNTGLKRRFPWVHKIEPYTDLELAEIFLKMIAEINWETTINKEEIAKLIKDNKELFKFAGGDIETFITKCKMSHATRVFNLDKEHKFILTKKDFIGGLEIVKKNNKGEEEDKPPPWMYI